MSTIWSAQLKASFALTTRELCRDEAERNSHLLAVLHRSRIMDTVAALRRDVDQAESMILKSELSQRKRVLRRLGYLESGGIVTAKGHVCLCPLLPCDPPATHVALPCAVFVHPRLLKVCLIMSGRQCSPSIM